MPSRFSSVHFRPSWTVRMAFVFATVASCGGESRECVPGDQIQCRCAADNSYGYRTCDATGHFSGPCDCILGLQPDAGGVIGYRSGRGSGSGTRDAGGP